MFGDPILMRFAGQVIENMDEATQLSELKINVIATIYPRLTMYTNGST